MQLTTTLKEQVVQNRIREVGINPNYWYPVGWADRVKPGQIIPVTVWQQAIAVFRDDGGQLHALEDACPHKGVALHKGEIQGCHLLCPYHGWEFNGTGKCVKIPYFPSEQKLPPAKARSYPVREKYNLIWVFPGDAALAGDVPLPEIPEYDDPQWLGVPIPAHFRAHFSTCNENTMDVFHGFLHRGLQGWFDPVLLNLSAGDDFVRADYRVSYQNFATQFLGISDRGDRVTTKTVSIRYNYPHYCSSLEGLSSIYLMRLPVGKAETRSFSYLFLKLPLPQWLLSSLKPQLTSLIWQFLFKRFLDQDVEMVESEQQNYLANPQRKYVEVNPAIIALQRTIIKQYELFLQLSASITNGQGDRAYSSRAMLEQQERNGA
ncbi:MAG: aromatic ring-hydroxylating dioxygenase subunit alpha [Cyanobacteria bacterium P01_E01_bin.42]